MKKFFLLTVIFSMALYFGQAQNYKLDLYEGEIPNAKPSEKTEKWTTTDIVAVTAVTEPTLEVYLPAKKNATGKAVVICPGGGYWALAYDWEGTDIAKWLNSKGIAGVVLKYRLPTSGGNVVPHLSPLMDAQRAIRTTRHNAEKWNIDPDQVGIMGFSAGGHLASTAGTHFDKGDPASPDPVERLSSRPDFMILMYPVITFNHDFMNGGSMHALLGENPSEELIREYSNELHVTPDTPPTILIHASDDRGVPPQNSLIFYEALIKNKVPAEMHIYPEGGHGFSLATGNPHLATWTDRVIEWINEEVDSSQ